MKINMSVEVEWLGEDGNLDETMRDELVKGVKKAISRDCLKRVEEQASKAIDAAIKEAVKNATMVIDERVATFVQQWLETEVVVTDKWGEETKRGSIKDIVKSQFDAVLNGFVNSEGRIVSKGSYGVQTSVIRYLTGEAVSEVVTKELQGFKSEIDGKIKKEINDGIRSNVSDLFAQMVVGAAQSKHAEQQAIESKAN